jgi:type IV secretory pathway VirB4 component
LSSHAADLLPLEMPWSGTPRSPLMLVESPYRQLIPFSPFDPDLSDANMLVAAASGHGKSMMTGQLLLQAARQDIRVSIIERGDSYRNVVEYMGGQMITMSLDSAHTLNPWDLETGEEEASREQVSFLKGLTKHMLGDQETSDLLDNILVDAIERTYRRAAMRPGNPTPTFGDLRDELQHYQDPDKNERVMEEARMAAFKLRNWVNGGVYENLFDRHTNLKLDAPWIYFNVEKLKDDARLEAAMSMLIAWATTKRAAGRSSQKSITVLEECWMLLESPFLADLVVQLYRTARKRNGGVWGVSQAVEDFTGTPQSPNPFGAAILKNTTTKIIGRQTGNLEVMREFLHLNDATLHRIKNLGHTQKGKLSDFVVVVGEKAETTHALRMVLSPVEYWIMTTYPRERWYRNWWMKTHRDLPLYERYRLLAAKFPQGLAALDELPEEKSGEVYEIEDLVKTTSKKSIGVVR